MWPSVLNYTRRSLSFQVKADFRLSTVRLVYSFVRSTLVSANITHFAALWRNRLTKTRRSVKLLKTDDESNDITIFRTRTIHHGVGTKMCSDWVDRESWERKCGTYYKSNIVSSSTDSVTFWVAPNYGNHEEKIPVFVHWKVCVVPIKMMPILM